MSDGSGAPKFTTFTPRQHGFSNDWYLRHAAVPELPSAPRSALVVANAEYADQTLRQMRSPALDASDLAEVLADPGLGKFSVTSVIDCRTPEIRVAIGDFLADRLRDELVLIYMSCHGLLDVRGRLYFAAADTLTSKLPATGIESTWILELLDECRARQQVLILDCCFSGAFARGAKGDNNLKLATRFQAGGSGRVVLTASRSTEYSFDGGAIEGLNIGGSVFTSALADGLRTGAADIDGDGLISAEDAHAYASHCVYEIGTKQTPQIWTYGYEGKIFLGCAKVSPSTIPSVIPGEIRAAFDNPYAPVRLGALEALSDWLLTADTDSAQMRAILTWLDRVSKNESPQIAKAAQLIIGPLGSGTATSLTNTVSLENSSSADPESHTEASKLAFGPTKASELMHHAFDGRPATPVVATKGEPRSSPHDHPSTNITGEIPGTGYGSRKKRSHRSQSAWQFTDSLRQLFSKFGRLLSVIAIVIAINILSLVYPDWHIWAPAAVSLLALAIYWIASVKQGDEPLRRDVESVLFNRLAALYSQFILSSDPTAITMHVWIVPSLYRKIFPYSVRRGLRQILPVWVYKVTWKPSLRRLGEGGMRRLPPSGVGFRAGYGLPGIALRDNEPHTLYWANLQDPEFLKALSGGAEHWKQIPVELTQNLSYPAMRRLAGRYSEALAVVIQDERTGEAIGCLTTEAAAGHTLELRLNSALHAELRASADLLGPLVSRRP